MQSLWAARGSVNNFVEIRKQWPQVDLVNSRRITNAHESSHEAEKTSPHIGAAATKKDIDRFGTMAQNLIDLHVTRYVFHRRLLPG